MVLLIFVADSCCEGIATLFMQPSKLPETLLAKKPSQLKIFAVTFFWETKALYEIGKRFPKEVTPLIFEF